MYKDKPYSYGPSRKHTFSPRQYRFLVGLLLLFFGMVWWIGGFTRQPGKDKPVKSKGTSGWLWLSGSDAPIVNWDDRREKVKEAFVLSWDGYEKYAWGSDEYHPNSKSGTDKDKPLGWIIVDALDTLMIMNLTSRLAHAREWIATTLDYDQDENVNTFETTIRMLGGFLSAHYLSTTYPNMAPLAEDDEGKPGEDLYLEKAADLADRLMGAFESDSGIPHANINLQTGKPEMFHIDGGASSTAEAASLQLEFKYLAHLTGETDYWAKAEKVMQVIDDNQMEGGLLPIYIYADRGTFRGENIRLGSRGDSYYEYLIKQYLQTSAQEPVYLDMWEQALEGVRKHLITYTKHTHLTIIGERPHGLHAELSPKMDHLVCFMPGTIALAATSGLTIEEAKKQGKWGPKQENEMALARELTKTCWGMYKVTATGLAPEITWFNIADPPRMESDGVLASSADFSNTRSHAPWRDDFTIKPQDMHNLQRPETVESLFYMWRITRDEMYREWGWEMFKAFVAYSAADDGAGFTSLHNVNEIPPILRDNMESFWLAETLKYFYLLFSEDDVLPLDGVVINTEAHIFPRFELSRGLKTGWKRREREETGQAEPKKDEKQGEKRKMEKEEGKTNSVEEETGIKVGPGVQAVKGEG